MNLNLAGWLCLLSLPTVFLIDLVTSTSVTDWMVYLLPLLGTLWVSRPRSFPFAVAAASSVLILLGAILSPVGEISREVSTNNRTRGLVVLWTCTVLVHQRRRAQEKLTDDMARRIRAEQETHELNVRWRALSALTADYVYTCRIEADGAVILDWATEALPRATGFTVQETTERGGPFSLVHPDDLETARERFQLLLSGRPGDGEIRLVTKTGEVRWTRHHGYPVWDRQQRRVVQLYGAVQDITESKLAEEALRESEKRFRLIAETIGEVFWIADPKVQNVLYVSPAFERIWGAHPQSVYRLPRSFLNTIHPEDRIRVASQLETYGGREAFDHEYRIIRPDGSIRWIWGRGFPVLNSTGEVECFVGIAQDVTDRKRAQEQLAVLGTGLEAAANGIMITDTAGDVIWVNAAFTQLTGYSSAEVLGRNPRLLRSGVQDRSFYEQLWNSISSGKVWSGEVTNRRKDGRLYVEEMTITPVRQGGVTTHFIAIKQDVTERKQAQAELLAWTEQLERRVADRTAELDLANRELEAFSYSVAHDLRAPLRAIDGFSALLAEHGAGQLGSEGQHYLQRVRQSAQRMDQLINDLLLLSRVTRSEMHRQAINLSTHARAIAADLVRTDPRRHVEFVIADDVVAEGDAGLLRAALENLLGNAWKYTGKHATARIEFGSAERDGQRVCFVRDDGAGFDMAYSSKLFGAFQRLHSLEEFDGNGIGLATVQRIIHRHGGRIWAEGEIEQGATFYFTVPAPVGHSELSA